MSANETANGEVQGRDQFDAAELRVLGVLAEKEALTPDSYPLTLNALTAGCNQLSSRDPVLQLTEAEVGDAVQRLIERRFVAEVRQAGARVAKYEHRMRLRWVLEQDKLAVLTILMLRGAQTAGEIRSRTGRLHDFDSVAAAEAALQFLIDKFPPLVARLPLGPGAKESRYVQMLSADGQESALQAAAQGAVARRDRISVLEEEVAQLRSELDALRAQFAAFREQFE